MKFAIQLAAVAALSATPVLAVEPIPVSITYNGHQPTQRLTKAPVGSTFDYDLYSGGQRYTETYKINPDRTLKLIDRVRSSGWN